MMAGAPFTHRMLLPSALGRWFTTDVGPPLLASFGTTWLMASALQSLPSIVLIGTAYLASLLAATLAAPVVRKRLFAAARAA